MRFNSWLHSVADAGREILFRRNVAEKQSSPDRPIKTLCEQLYSSKGEALGTALARDVVTTYQDLSESERLAFFRLLVSDYSPDPDEIIACADNYITRRDDDSLRSLTTAVEAPRQKLLRRINMAPGGTATIVKMREHLLQMKSECPQLDVVDSDFDHLLKSWFNRGFLTLHRIDWKTSADILEKLMNYEAVHAIDSWDDLRRRLAEDRRCYAFFHPALPEEPLIFVQVALVNQLAGSIQELLQASPPDGDESPANTAIFYSISDCQKGLKGISFGNFLIKQVVMELRAEMPGVTQFATLSPLPGFTRWLDKQIVDGGNNLLEAGDVDKLAQLRDVKWNPQHVEVEGLESLLLSLCEHYLVKEKRNGEPVDPVARFHLRNGAMIGRLNWLGDTSPKGFQQSAGILVNYNYDLEQVEKNHEEYVENGTISTLWRATNRAAQVGG